MNALNLSNFSSFRELDVLNRKTKGWAFKQFKRLQAQLVEHEDYLWFDQQSQADTINQLRQSGRIYGSTVNLVLLSPAGLEKFNQLADKDAT